MDIIRKLCVRSFFFSSLKQSVAEEFLSFYYVAVDDSTTLSGLRTDCPFDSATMFDRGRMYIARYLFCITYSRL